MPSSLIWLASRTSGLARRISSTTVPDDRQPGSHAAELKQVLLSALTSAFHAFELLQPRSAEQPRGRSEVLSCEVVDAAHV